MRPLLTALASLYRRARASVWAAPLLKLVFALGGLGVLAGIGRTISTAGAAVGGLAPPAVVSAAATDGGPPADASVLDAREAAAPPAAATAPPHARGARATADDPVYLNEATIDDLERLPGIGDKRARAILDLRTKLGRFRQIEELMRIKGIGRATLRKIRPLVRLERPDGG